MRRALLLLLLAGCHNISPPPFVMRHQGAQPDAPGDLRIALLVGYSQGVLAIDPGYGIVLQSTYQADEWWKAGASVAVGFNGRYDAANNRRQHPLWLVAGRAFGRYHPDFTDSMSSEGGLGLGYTSSDTIYLTTDLGGTFGGRNDFDDESGDLYLYAAPTVSASFPLRRGLPVREPNAAIFGPPTGEPPSVKVSEVKPAWFLSLGLGALAEGATAGDQLGGSLELHTLFADDGDERSLSIGVSGGPSARFSD